MRLINILKSFFIELIITFSVFSIIYPLMRFLLGLDILFSDFVMGVVISILISVGRVLTKEKNEQTQEFIKSNYWKLKNELNRKINGNKKRNNSK